MKKLMFVAVALCAVSLFADTPKKAADPKKEMTPAEREAFRLKKTGGFIERKGAVKGMIAVIDTQSILTPSNLIASLDQLSESVKMYNIQIFRKDPGDPVALKKSVGADLAVIIVANDKDPSLLVAPDDGWALVNMAKTTQDLKTPSAKAKFLDSRCRKAFLRAFVGACSGLSSSYPDNIMDMASPADLDFCKEFVPFDKFLAMDRYLQAKGLSPRVIKSYRVAYIQGWAPPPTNDIQRAVIEDVKRIQAEKAARDAAKKAADSAAKK